MTTMDAEYKVMVDATFARPGVAFGATSYASGFLSAHLSAVNAGKSTVSLYPFLPKTGFEDVERAYGQRSRRSHLPGYLGRGETSLASHLISRDNLFHWLGNHIPPAARRQRSVITLHDLMARHYLEAGYPVSKRMLAAYRRALRSVGWADGVVISDDLTREKVLEIAPDVRVVVAPPGPGGVATVENLVPVAGLRKPALLVLGANGPHKRLEQYREAFLRGPLPRAGWTLVHAGRGTAWRDDHTVSLTGMSDGEIAWLLQNCRALAMPSSYEGWGMPVTEAAIFGAPVLVSEGVPSHSHAATIAPVHVLRSLDDPQGWEFLLDQGDTERRDVAARRRLADAMWQEHVRLVDGLYTSLPPHARNLAERQGLPRR